MKKGPALIAHRGLARDYPENTLAAFRAAGACGVDGVELDVQFAACGTPMVIHDASLERTTGRPGFVGRMHATELAEYSAHEPNRLGDRFLGEPLPTLQQASEVLASTGDLTVFIEIKADCLRRHALPAMMERVARDSAVLGDRRVVISFVDEVVQTIRSLSGIRVGWVLPAFHRGVLERARALAPEFLFCDQTLLPVGRAPLPGGDWAWAAFEVTSRSEARQLYARGVTWLESMAPARLRHCSYQPFRK